MPSRPSVGARFFPEGVVDVNVLGRPAGEQEADPSEAGSGGAP
jgi:hypothetical protein